MAEDRIVAVGLLSARDLDVLGHGFRRVIPIDDLHDFNDLLRAIDDADRRVRGEGDAPAPGN